MEGKNIALLQQIKDLEKKLKETEDRLSNLELLLAKKNEELDEIHLEFLDKNESLLELSAIDELTKVYNRRKITELLSLEYKRAKRYKNNLSIIMMDIDHFKKINDNYGHQVGDKILIEISILLKTNIRSSDYIGRWGGEEFLIITPNINGEDGVKLAEKLRTKIKEYNFYMNLKITSSFGVAKHCGDDNIDILVKKSDLALYEAKKERNKVCFYKEIPVK